MGQNIGMILKGVGIDDISDNISKNVIWKKAIKRHISLVKMAKKNVIHVDLLAYIKLSKFLINSESW